MKAQEQAKYEKVWSHWQYRVEAPGQHLVGDAIQKLEMQPGQSVIDFGCGTGRASKALQDAGFKVAAVDHADNCLDPGIEVSFTQVCLWEPLELKADYGFCTDVMEHIPPEYVESVLETISSCVGAAYFQIATRPDVMGAKLLGEPLHLTVQDRHWWSLVLLHYWDDVAFEDHNGAFVAVCR